MSAKEAYGLLKNIGLIDYGSLIFRERLESAFGFKMNEDDNPWRWTGHVLQLKEIIASEGYFSTQRGCHDGLRILSLEEMPERVSSITETIKRRQRKSISTMQRADFGSLDNDLQVKHLHALNLLVSLNKATRTVLASCSDF